MLRDQTEMSERDLLEDRALSLDTRVFMMLSAGADDPMLTLDLSMPQLKVLLLVERLDSPTMGDLAHMLGVGQPAMSALVDRLSDHGLSGARMTHRIDASSAFAEPRRVMTWFNAFDWPDRAASDVSSRI